MSVLFLFCGGNECDLELNHNSLLLILIPLTADQYQPLTYEARGQNNKQC